MSFKLLLDLIGQIDMEKIIQADTFSPSTHTQCKMQRRGGLHVMGSTGKGHRTNYLWNLILRLDTVPERASQAEIKLKVNSGTLVTKSI